MLGLPKDRNVWFFDCSNLHLMYPGAGFPLVGQRGGRLLERQSAVLPLGLSLSRSRLPTRACFHFINLDCPTTMRLEFRIQHDSIQKPRRSHHTGASLFFGFLWGIECGCTKSGEVERREAAQLQLLTIESVPRHAPRCGGISGRISGLRPLFP